MAVAVAVCLSVCLSDCPNLTGGKTPDLVVDYYTLDGGKEAPPTPPAGFTDSSFSASTSTSANASSSATAPSAPSQEYFLQLKPGPEYVKVQLNKQLKKKLKKKVKETHQGAICFE